MCPTGRTIAVGKITKLPRVAGAGSGASGGSISRAGLKSLDHVSLVYDAIDTFCKGDVVVVAVWTGAPLVPPLFHTVAESGARIHWWCGPSDSTDAPTLEADDTPLAVLHSAEILRLHEAHTNLCVTTVRSCGDDFLLRVGVTAKGYIPLGETAFPSSMEVMLDDGRVVTARVDVF